MALRRPLPSTLVGLGLLVLTSAGAVFLFNAGFDETDDDKTRAAFIGAATALASGFVVLAGGLLTSARTKNAQDEQTTRATRQTHYANVLALVPAYDGHRRRAHLWCQRSLVPGICREDQDEHSMHSLAALADAEALESEILGALAAADIVAGPEVQAYIKELHSAFQALQPNPSIEVVDLPWPAFSRAAKAELRNT